MGRRADRRGGTVRAHFRAVRGAVFAVFLVASASVIYASAEYAGARAAADVHRKAMETLALQTEALNGVLDKYRLLPPMLARQDGVAALFSDSPDAEGRSIPSEKAKSLANRVAGMSGAKNVALLHPDGRLLASARGIALADPIAKNTLFEAVRQGRLGRAAVMMSNGEHAYAFASGVRRSGGLAGIVVVYVDFDRLEAVWSLSANPIFVDDSDGRVFLTNRTDWRLKPIAAVMSQDSDPALVRLRKDASLYADVSRTLPLLGWRLHVLADQGPVRAAQINGAAIAGLLAALAGGCLALMVRRREVGILRSRQERASALRLERIVRDRTRALSVSNRSLSHEIEERRATEEKLRRAQAELVQSAKLAALGQMSVALSHEFNQPLAAIRANADNAQRLLARNRLPQATEAVSRIAALVDRMAELARTLLSFSRRPGTDIAAIGLSAVLDEALLLIRPRARKAGVAIEIDPSLRHIAVMGGRVRLSQVFVNLINNAIDALKDRGDGYVQLSCEAAGGQDGWVTILVTDNGPGIAEACRATIFDPFFTTKPVGEGIGIGLAIADSIVRAFGGRIELRPSSEGAQFAVLLVAAESHSVAAE